MHIRLAHSPYTTRRRTRDAEAVEQRALEIESRSQECSRLLSRIDKRKENDAWQEEWRGIGVGWSCSDEQINRPTSISLPFCRFISTAYL